MAGRPTVVTEEIIEKLEGCFRDGAHVLEACENVGISRQAYYDRLNTDQVFADRMNTAQEYTTEIARAVVSRAIKRGDKESAKWWLERRVKEKFSPRSELTGKDGKELPTPTFIVQTEQAKEQLQKLYEGSDRSNN